MVFSTMFGGGLRGELRRCFFFFFLFHRRELVREGGEEEAHTAASAEGVGLIMAFAEGRGALCCCFSVRISNSQASSIGGGNVLMMG